MKKILSAGFVGTGRTVSGRKTIAALTTAFLVFSVLVTTAPGALAATTGSISATTPGYISQWTVASTGLVSGNCSTNYISTNTTNNRSAFTVNLSTVPDGATITSVAVSTTDRENSGNNGTYRTFARLNSVNTDATSDLNATSGSGCTARGPQTLNVADTVKVSGGSPTTLEIGVFKTSGDTDGVRIGSVSVVITYTPVPHTITSSAGAGGTISPNGATVVADGANQTFTITPSTGNIVSDVLVDSISSGRSNSHTFSTVKLASMI